MARRVLITGCDSGLGREFARQYAEAGWEVVATYLDPGRNPVAGAVRHVRLDVTSAEDVDRLASDLGSGPLDLFVSNAGVASDAGKLGALDYRHFAKTVEVNAIAPLRLAEALLPNLTAAGRAKIALVSSRLGSIGANLTGGHYAYRASKAALNAIGRNLALELFPRGVAVVTLHPGWVRTPNGGDAAPLSAEESVAGMRGVIERLGSHETGQFYAYNGEGIPW